MIAFLLGLAFAGSTICIQQEPKKHEYCVLMTDNITKDGRTCILDNYSMKFVWYKLLIPDGYTGFTHDGFWQCTFCVRCD